MNWQGIREVLAESGICIAAGVAPRPIGGGGISAAWQLQTSAGWIFLKTGDGAAFEMFAAEAAGLNELEAAKAIRVPQVLAIARAEGAAMLALEWLDLGAPSRDTETLLGTQLAELHRHTQTLYGWYRDNTIGLTPQNNTANDCWLDFFREQRLEYQLRLASQNGFGDALQQPGRKLLDRLDRFFADYTPCASLLHGDLWGGNWSSLHGQPVIFDPAVYYGDRETDLAMTRLFGGFGSDFYAAYYECWPPDPGSEQRLPLYQLYHVLNHLNLFGAGYLGQAQVLLQTLIKTID